MPPRKGKRVSLARKGKVQNKVKIKLVAVCEGQNTEPDFIDDFRLAKGNGLVDVRAIRAAGVPLTIVDKAIAEKKALAKVARRSADPIDRNFEVWAVFDRDEHPHIPAAFDKAYANGIKIAYSNPCFELWPMLHIRNQGAEIHRHDLQRALSIELPCYDADGAKVVKLADLPNNYDEAKRRAEALGRRHEEVGVPKANPYTDVYNLFDAIIENGKK